MDFNLSLFSVHREINILIVDKNNQIRFRLLAFEIRSDILDKKRENRRHSRYLLNSWKSRPSQVVQVSASREEPSLRYSSVPSFPTYIALGKDAVVDLRRVARPRTRNAFQLLKSFKR